MRDALRAVDNGERADPKAADWPKMRSDLEDLLKKPEDKNKDQKNKDQQDKDQNQQQKQDRKQDQKQDDKQQQGQPKDQNRDQQGSPSQSKQQDSKDQQQPKPEDSKSQTNQSAFGDMSKPTPTPARKEPQRAMQKVGGVRKDQPEDPARSNPELAVPLEKLEQLKSEDSPAELFGMLRKGEPTPTPANTGKNW